MGIGTSRRPQRASQGAANNSNSYKYPPKTENYFSSHFIMGGERFESSKPDAYLFGENEDLNFLGSKPTPFPYPVPQPHEPTRTLRSLVNIRRDSVRFVKEIDESSNQLNHNASQLRYNIEFTFDTDVKCAITIYYFAVEEISNKQTVYHPRDPQMNSDTFHYKRGANQTFSQPTHLIEPSKFSEDDWKYNPEAEVIPVVIHCVVEEPEHAGHSHMTFAVVEKSLDGGYSLKALKQKQMVDGLCYLLQEIYGIENKNTQRARQQDDDIEDNGSECVICMCETRDTLILPCRHLCLCNSCADNLRYQANNCPICRAKFHALLQIKAMHKKRTNPSATAPVTNEASDSTALSQDGIPPGYEAVSLIEALNGPTQPHCACSVPTLPTDTTSQSLCPTASVAPSSDDTNATKNKTDKDTEVNEELHTQSKEASVGTVDGCDQTELTVKERTLDSIVLELALVVSMSTKEDKCYDMAIPITDDEDSEEPVESSYATPLHQSRVVPRSPCVDTDPPVHQLSDPNSLLQPTEDSSSDLRDSSSSSTRDLLDHGQEDSADDMRSCEIVGCTDHINVSVV